MLMHSVSALVVALITHRLSDSTTSDGHGTIQKSKRVNNDRVALHAPLLLHIPAGQQRSWERLAEQGTHPALGHPCKPGGGGTGAMRQAEQNC